jgi:SAM-dependent methyltransferase
MALNASRVYLERFARDASSAVSPGSLVLDAGAGFAPYRHLFAGHRYETADFARLDKPYAPDLTYVTDLASIPVEDDRYDLVFLSQVLEHLPEPARVLGELHRVLRPGGQIWISCPMYYEEHEQPYDFFRYTQFALRKLVTDAGFREPTIDWLEGYLMTVSYQLAIARRALPRYLRPVGLGLWLMSELLARADLRRKITTVGHPKNYTVVAVAGP